MRTADPALHQLRRSEILRAAETCFTTEGFHKASMADIAKAAGLSMGLLYRYFRNKADIVVSFSERDRELAVQAINQFAESHQPLEDLATAVPPLIEHQTQPSMVRMVCEIMAEAGRNPLVLEALQRDDRVLTAALKRALRRQQQAGRITRKFSAAVLADILLTLFDGCIGRAVCTEGFDAKRASKSMLHVLRGVLKPD